MASIVPNIILNSPAFNSMGESCNWVEVARDCAEYFNPDRKVTIEDLARYMTVDSNGNYYAKEVVLAFFELATESEMIEMCCLYNWLTQYELEEIYMVMKGSIRLVPEPFQVFEFI